MVCKNCGGTMVGDGYTMVLHCEFAFIDHSLYEPDAEPVYCTKETIMKVTEADMKRIKESLCTYDKRSPYYDPESERGKGDCYCDNCYDGRAWLAELLLKIVGEFT